MSEMATAETVLTPNKAQRHDEMGRFLEIVRQEKVKRYLEIGLQRGITFRNVGQVLPESGTMVGVDLPGSAWGVKDGSGPGLINAVCDEMRAAGRSVHVFWGDSRSAQIIASAGRHAPYDLALIDADHSLEGVVADWENYGQLSRIVAFHDIDTPAKPGITPEKLAKYGVHTLWQSLKPRYRHVEIIGEQRGMGIGVLWRDT